MIFAAGDSVSSRSVMAVVHGIVKLRSDRDALSRARSDSSRIPTARPFLIHDRHLRNIRGAHPLERGQQGVVGPDGDDFARFIAMGDQIAQIALRRPMDESLLRHPEIVVHLREIFVAGVGTRK